MCLGGSDFLTSLDGVRFHGDGALILDGIETPEERERFAERQSARWRKRSTAGTGRALLYQLIGLKASTPEGEHLGEVVDIIETGAHDVLVIAPEGSRASRSPAGELLIPHHSSYVLDVDPDAGTITVLKPVYTGEE